MRQIFWCVLVAACNGDKTDTSFPAGLDPLEENTASWPSSISESVETSIGEADDYHWAHARGYIEADINDVYPCLREEMVNADRREVASWTRDADVEADYEHSYRLNFLVENIIDLEFSDTWRHGSITDDSGTVTELRARWKMTEANDFMYLKEGSIVSTIPEAGWTALEIAGHLSAAQRDAETMETYILDLYADLAACLDGTDYPTFDD